MSEHAKERDEQIAAIEGRRKAITHAPWRLRYNDSGMCNGVAVSATVLPCDPFTGPPIAEIGSKKANAEFIFNAPNDVRYLLAQLAAQGEALTQAQATIQQLREYGELEAALASAVVPQEEGWQPVETAPKADALLYRPGLPLRERIAIRRADDWCGDTCCPSARPTHWMPLPEPPDALLSSVSQGRSQ